MNKIYVIDANVLFSAFISGKDIYDLLFSQTTLYIPDYAFLEIEKYKNRILKKTKLTAKDFQEYVLNLLAHITVIPGLLLSRDSLRSAFNLCKDIDEKDTLYIAVAIEFNIPLITNDKALYNGLRTRQFFQVELLSEILRQLI